MKSELYTQKGIAKTATNAWNDTLKTLEGKTLNGIKIFTHDNIAKTVKYLVDGFFAHKKTAEQVPELEQQVYILKQNQATYKQQEFTKLPPNIQDTATQHGRQLIEQAKQQAEQSRLAHLQAQQAEKQRLQSLHKTKNWSELTPMREKKLGGFWLMLQSLKIGRIILILRGFLGCLWREGGGVCRNIVLN